MIFFQEKTYCLDIRKPLFRPSFRGSKKTETKFFGSSKKSSSFFTFVWRKLRRRVWTASVDSRTVWMSRGRSGGDSKFLLPRSLRTSRAFKKATVKNREKKIAGAERKSREKPTTLSVEEGIREVVEDSRNYIDKKNLDRGMRESSKKKKKTTHDAETWRRIKDIRIKNLNRYHPKLERDWVEEKI